MSQAHSSAHRRSPVAVIGRGRLGGALSGALPRAGYPLMGPLGRSYTADELSAASVVLLCVPDREIAAAAATLVGRLDGRSPLIGHCSGATGLQPLLMATGGSMEVLSLHPLMTVADGHEPGGAGVELAGASAAVAGSSERARRISADLARGLGMHPVEVGDEARAAYHAAASMASNFLVTLEVAAEQLAGAVGLERSHLVPLVRQTVDNWAARGAGALTGPIARGDEPTVARQREAVAHHTPGLLGLFDALALATRSIGEAVPA